VLCWTHGHVVWTVATQSHQLREARRSLSRAEVIWHVTVKSNMSRNASRSARHYDRLLGEINAAKWTRNYQISCESYTSCARPVARCGFSWRWIFERDRRVRNAHPKPLRPLSREMHGRGMFQRSSRDERARLGVKCVFGRLCRKINIFLFCSSSSTSFAV
jgi:hypothetical protein